MGRGKITWVFMLVLGMSLPGCKQQRTSVVRVYAAASLNQVLSTAKRRLEERNPKLEIRVEPSGSQIAARKIAELNNPGDVVLVADYRVIESILMPQHAGWLIQFASNEIVLAHGAHSQHTEEINSSNWSEILLRADVRLGRVDENTAPIGYQTLLAWKLAGEHFKGQNRFADLAERLLRKVPPERIVPDAEELAALLQSKTIDYAFVFKSTAMEHNLKSTSLPAEINLSRLALEPTYARAEVMVKMKMKNSAPPRAIQGSAILYALAIPDKAPNPAGAEELVLFLLQGEGRELLARSGFLPLSPPICRGPQRPAGLLSGLCPKK